MSNLSEAQMHEMTEAFRMFDANGDGTITSSELMTVMRNLGQNPTNAEVDQMIREMDPDGNGKIEFRDFIDGMSSHGVKSQEESEEELKSAFKVFDRDGNGFITCEELRHTMTTLGERMTNEEVDAMMQEADLNGDGKVNYEEFAKIMSSRP